MPTEQPNFDPSALPALQAVETADGYRIAVRRFDPPPATAVRAAVIMASAMGVKQDFYAPFARWLAAQGVATYTFDCRGMFASRPAGGLRGFPADISTWAGLDYAALIEQASARHPGLPLFWIGHSLGGQILGLIPNRDRIDAMLSIAVGSGYFRFNAKPMRYYAAFLWHVLMPLALRTTGYFPGKKLRAVGDLPYGVAAQWRKWCLNVDYLGAEGNRVREQLAQIEIPITAFSIEDDELMTLRGTQALYSLYEHAPLEIRRVKPADHGLRAIGHFGFFRPKMQAALWPLVSAWVERRIELLPEHARAS